jgi:hypothetical protein
MLSSTGIHNSNDVNASIGIVFSIRLEASPKGFGATAKSGGIKEFIV